MGAAQIERTPSTCAGSATGIGRCGRWPGRSARQQRWRITGWFWLAASSDGDVQTVQRHLALRGKVRRHRRLGIVAAGPQRWLLCVDEAAQIQAVDPERNSVAGPGAKSTRPAFHSGPKHDLLPPSRARTQLTTARCSSSAPSNSGTETSSGRLRLAEISSYVRRRPRTLRRNRRRSRRHRRKPTAGPATLACPTPIAVDNVHVVAELTAAHLVLPWRAPSLRQPQSRWARGV